jgi:hypothetical protein
MTRVVNLLSSDTKMRVSGQFSMSVIACFRQPSRRKKSVSLICADFLRIAPSSGLLTGIDKKGLIFEATIVLTIWRTVWMCNGLERRC